MAEQTEFGRLIRRLVALAGGDPTTVQIPDGKRRLHVRSQTIGQARIIVIEPARYNGVTQRRRCELLTTDAAGCPHVVAESSLRPGGEVLLRGYLTTLNGNGALWLVLRGGWSVPVGVAPDDPEREQLQAKLETLYQRYVYLRGIMHEAGFVVDSVLPMPKPNGEKE